jgi:hypothetical protein
LEPLCPNKIFPTALFSNPILLAGGKLSQLETESQFSPDSGYTNAPAAKADPGERLAPMPLDLDLNAALGRPAGRMTGGAPPITFYYYLRNLPDSAMQFPNRIMLEIIGFLYGRG